MAIVTGIGSSPELAFLTQMFVFGLAAGMLYSILRERRSGSLERWSVQVAYGALAGLVFGTLYLLLEGILGR